MSDRTFCIGEICERRQTGAYRKRLCVGFCLKQSALIRAIILERTARLLLPENRAKVVRLSPCRQDSNNNKKITSITGPDGKVSQKRNNPD